MGVLGCATFNAGMASRNRETRDAETATRKAVPVSSLRPEDRLALLEGEAWTVKQATSTGKPVPGLGVWRWGVAKDHIQRVIAVSDSGESQVFEMPKTYLVLTEVGERA